VSAYLSLHPGKGSVQQISTEGCPLLVGMTSVVAAAVQLIGFLLSVFRHLLQQIIF